MIDLANFITLIDETKLALLESLATDEAARQKQVVEYREYYAGDHETHLSDRLKEFLGNDAQTKFRFNQCPVVIESLVDRLSLSGFEPIGIETTPGEQSTTRGLIEFAAEIWENSRLDAVQDDVYRQAAIDQKSYLVLDIDPDGKIQFHQHDLYTDPTLGGSGEGVKLHRANARSAPMMASKRWSVRDTNGDTVRHLVLYYPDRIERYVHRPRRGSNGSGPYSEAGWEKDISLDGPLFDIWPQPWTDVNGTPLGIPVIEFVNGQASELHEIIPIQKALNKAYIDLIAAADLAGLGVLFAAGWVPTSDGKPITTDERGKVTSSNEPLKRAAGDIYFTENPDGKLERVAGEDLDRLIRVVDRHLNAIAQVSRTPITNFQLFGQIPSDATQRQLDAGLLAKVEARQRDYGNAFEDMIYLARRVALGAPRYNGDGRIIYGLDAYAGYNLNDTERISAIWQDAVVRNEKEHLETLQLKKELGVDSEQIFLEMNYSAEQAARWADAIEARRISELNAQLALTQQAPAQEATGGGQVTT